MGHDGVKRPILGVCVGMQLFADSSDEHGYQEGLGWLGVLLRDLLARIPIFVCHTWVGIMLISS